MAPKLLILYRGVRKAEVSVSIRLTGVNHVGTKQFLWAPMCVCVALYHACNHPFKWVWRPCNNPLRRSLMIPQSYRFIPCGEGVYAGLAAFKSLKSEYTADKKLCPSCERRKRATARKLKRAAMGKLREEKYSRLCPWFQGYPQESDLN